MKFNQAIFYEKFSKFNFANELKALIASANDDLVVILRIHLMCEQILEAWICGCTEKVDFFSKPQELSLSFTAKNNIAANLGLPKPAYNFFKLFNKVRNDFSHDIYQKQIKLGFSEDLQKHLSALTPADFSNMAIQYNEVEKYSLSSSHTPERIKLCMLFLILQMQLSLTMKTDEEEEKDVGAKRMTINIKIPL